jgi:integrase
MPKIYRHEKCPRFLKDGEIRAMLSSVDQNTAIGKRDFAILLILSNYGLRGIEIAKLRLDDIE